MKPGVRLTILALSVMLSACQIVGPDYHLPKDAALNRPDLQGELAGKGADVISAPVEQDWWRLYQDQRLNKLIQDRKSVG